MDEILVVRTYALPHSSSNIYNIFIMGNVTQKNYKLKAKFGKITEEM